MTVTSSITPTTRQRLKRSVTIVLASIRSSILILVATCGLVTAIGVTSASADSSGQHASIRCGYSESDGHAWYNHCTSDGSYIQIKYDRVLGRDGYLCVGPGVTDLGRASSFRNAWYTGNLCSP
jgi:hypothetical protein